MTGRRDPLPDLEVLYRERFPHFVRVAVAIVGDTDTALEAVHDGFADAIRGRRGFRAEGPLEAWAWRAVVNAALRARRQPRDERLDEALIASNGSATDPDERLRAAVAALPERQRLVVFLRYFADLDYRSIAAALGIEVGTVSATLHAAHVALRDALEEART